MLLLLQCKVLMCAIEKRSYSATYVGALAFIARYSVDHILSKAQIVFDSAISLRTGTSVVGFET